MLNATSPLFGAVIAFFWLRDPLTVRKLFGLALGILGVAILAGWSPIDLNAVVLAVDTGIIGRRSVVWTRQRVHQGACPQRPRSRHGHRQPVGSQPVVDAACPVHLAGCHAVDDGVALHAGAGGGLDGLCLSALSSAWSWMLGPTTALTVTFLVPVFGVLWGALFLGEPVGISTLVGGLVVLAGTALVVGVRLPHVQPARGFRTGSLRHAATPPSCVGSAAIGAIGICSSMIRMASGVPSCAGPERCSSRSAPTDAWSCRPIQRSSAWMGPITPSNGPS